MRAGADRCMPVFATGSGGRGEARSSGDDDGGGRDGAITHEGTNPMMNRQISAALVMLLLTGATMAQDDAQMMTNGACKDLDPVISPDGNMLAYSSNRTGSFNIFVFDYRTEGTYQLTESPKDDRYPSWSPDSKKLVFTSERTGNGDIFETSVKDKAGFLQLTDQETHEEYASYAGNELLFARSEKKGLLRRKMNVVMADFKAGTIGGRILSEGDEPRLSPDGRRIVFVSRRTKNNDIWSMKTDGTEVMQLTSSPDEDENPNFSPDGKHIVFSSDRTGDFNIYIMDVDGGNVRQLTSNPVDDKQPCWSRGGYIYFTRHMTEGVWNLWRIKAPN